MMMKIKFLIAILVASIIFKACSVKYSSNISTWIEYESKDSCSYFCQTAKLYIKNNTSNRYYIPAFLIQTKDKLGFYLEKTPYINRFAKYKNKALKSNASIIRDCSCKYYGTISGGDESNFPPNFIKDAKTKELIRFCNINNFDKNNKKAKTLNDSWVESYYRGYIYFIEPHEKCYVEVKYLDLIIKENRTIVLNTGLNAKETKHGKWLSGKEQNKKEKKNKIKYYYSYLPEIAGYKLFKGTIKTNTLVIKNGEVIKNKPRNKGRLKNVKTYYY